MTFAPPPPPTHQMAPHDADVQDFVDHLADELQRAVVVEDKGHALVAHSSHDGEVDAVRQRSVITRQTPPEAIEWVRAAGLIQTTGPIRLAANPALGAVGRICAAIRSSNGTVIGILSVLDPGETLPDEALERCRHAGEILSGLLQELWISRERAHASEAAAVEALISSADPQARRDAAAKLERDGHLAAGAALFAVVVHPRRDALSDPLAGLLMSGARRAVPSRALVATRRDDHIALVASLDAYNVTRLTEVADRIHQAVDKVLGGESSAPGSATVAFGEAVAEAHDLASSYNHAQLAARVAGKSMPAPSAAVDWRALGVNQILAHVPDDELGHRPIDQRIKRLDANRDLLETLEVYLDLAGDAARTAERLGLQRGSLYYRLGRIADLTGLDLKSGADRLDAHLAIKALRLTGALSGSRL